MDGPSLVELITQAGSVLGLALFAMWQLDRVWKERIIAAERYSSGLQALQERMLTVLVEFTEQLTRMTEATSAMMRMLERMGDDGQK